MGTTLSAKGVAIVTVVVPGFLPSAQGFRFSNSFPHVPVRYIGIPGVLTLPIGDASNGLCGGMVFAVRDYFEAGRQPPPDASAPSEGTLFDYLVDRLFDSFDLPLGPARYLGLMNPAFPDGETLLSRLGLAPHGRAWQMVKTEWPRIRQDIDSGHPSPLGLVRARSSNPFDLKWNHQVIAFGYDMIRTSLRLHLYDPNQPGNDNVVMSIDLADPTGVPLELSPPGPSVFAFFRSAYEPAAPP